jgi:hypothetical protein
MSDSSAPADTEREYPYWNRVYLAVVLVTIAVIAALALFSAMFTP